jgi:cytochrome c oxidase assembly protein subunit 15
MRIPRLSPTAFRRLVGLAVALLAVIVVTGGAVRLTGSGLGCITWPACTDTSYVAPAAFHSMVEFGNRMLVIAVAVVIGATALGSLLRRDRRWDLVALSWLLVAGYVAQAVIGGLSVIYKLTPGWVIGHFLVSMALLWAALVLHHRSAPGWRRRERPAVRRELVWTSRLLPSVTAAVLVAGTIVTGTGPHAGSPDTPRLTWLSLRTVTQLHADLALLLTGLVVATVVLLRALDAPHALRRHSVWLVAAVLFQVAVGFTQYFLGVPAGLVGVHIAGATVLWMAAVRLALDCTASEEGLTPYGASQPHDAGRPAGIPAAHVPQPAATSTPG